MGPTAFGDSGRHRFSYRGSCILNHQQAAIHAMSQGTGNTIPAQPAENHNVTEKTDSQTRFQKVINVGREYITSAVC